MASQLYVIFDEQRYRIHTDHPILVPPEHISPRAQSVTQAYTPLTVVHWSKSRFEETDQESTCQDFGETDDVWSTAFASC
jgi:hypothetical protein